MSRIIINILLVVLIIRCFYTYRLEPIGLFKSRINFYKNITKGKFAIDIEYDDKRGFYCKNLKEINRDEEVIKMAKNMTYSTFDDFPLKREFLNLLVENPQILENKILVSKMLLVFRIMFDLKANLTETFVLMKKYSFEINITSNQEGNKNIYDVGNFRNYLRKRNKNEFLLNYLNFLPLAYNYGETSWSDEDILEYQRTGFIPIFKNKLLKIYKSVLEDLKNNPVLLEFCKNWLNEENSSYFLSIYGYVNSKAFPIKYKEFNYNSDNNSDQDSLLNKKIDDLSGYILVPIFDLCLNNIDMISRKNFKFFSDDVYLSIISSNNLKENSEITFNFSTDFSNDYTLLNYGYTIKNNPHQEYILRFDVPDKDYKFYNNLKKRGIEIKSLSILEVEKLTILINLRKNILSKEMIKIISTLLDLKKQNWAKLPKKDKENEILLIYYSLIITNIQSIFDENTRYIDIFSELTSYVGKILDNEAKIIKLTKIINDNTENFIKKKNDTLSPLDDDLQNLFYFKHLHNNIKKSLIYSFTFDNLKIVFSQLSTILNKLKKNLAGDILNIKNKYV